MKDKSSEEIEYTGSILKSAKNIEGVFVCSDHVESITACAFEGCSGLTHLFLPKNLFEIEDFAFQDCSNLSWIFFPEQLVNDDIKIADLAFIGCEKISYIVCDNEEVLNEVKRFLPEELQSKLILQKGLGQYMGSWLLNANEALSGKVNQDVAKVITKKGLDLHFFKAAPEDLSKVIEENQFQTYKKS